MCQIPAAAPGPSLHLLLRCWCGERGPVKSLLCLLGPVCGSPANVGQKPCVCPSVCLWPDLNTGLIFPHPPSTRVSGQGAEESGDPFPLLAWVKSVGGFDTKSLPGKVSLKKQIPVCSLSPYTPGVMLSTVPCGYRSDLSRPAACPWEGHCLQGRIISHLKQSWDLTWSVRSEEWCSGNWFTRSTCLARERVEHLLYPSTVQTRGVPELFYPSEIGFPVCHVLQVGGCRPRGEVMCAGHPAA